MELRLSQIAYFPVKSCAPCYPEEAEITDSGFRYDRAWMVVNKEGFFLTQREHPEMALIQVSAEPEALSIRVPGADAQRIPVVDDAPTRQVTVWEDQCEAIDQGDQAAALLSAYLGRPCRLVRMRPGFRRELGPRYRVTPEVRVGFADSTPFMLISEASLDDLNGRLAAPVQMSRFRPNLVISGGLPFQEDVWQRIRIGQTLFHLVRDCIRCEIITVNQETGEKGVEPMETLGSYRYGPRGIRFGRKVVHQARGVIRLGDTVEVLE